jgi:hypothetical protein
MTALSCNVAFIVVLMAIMLLCGVYAGEYEKTSVADQEFNGSRVGTNDYIMEMQVINQGIQDYELALRTRNLAARKPLLCTVFAKATLSTFINTLSNKLHMGDTCDWAIIFYAGKLREEKNICNHHRLRKNLVMCKRARASLNMINGVDMSNSKEFQSKSVPKTVLYQELFPLVQNYERIFLLDEDISLVDFNYKSFSDVWDCGFPRQAAPLIVQPTVAEDTQFFDFVSASTWRDKQTIATASGIVEQQVPLFDSLFFEWFIRRVLVHTVQFALEYGVDWGHDRSWCNAAAMYAVHVLKWSPSHVTCAIITVTQIHHLNTHAMVGKRINRPLFRSLGNKVVQKYIDRYPTWVLVDILERPNPIHPVYGKKFKKIDSLNETCIADKEKAKQVAEQLLLLSSPQLQNLRQQINDTAAPGCGDNNNNNNQVNEPDAEGFSFEAEKAVRDEMPRN